MNCGKSAVTQRRHPLIPRSAAAAEIRIPPETPAHTRNRTAAALRILVNERAASAINGTTRNDSKRTH